jgi:hypothetical protein
MHAQRKKLSPDALIWRFFYRYKTLVVAADCFTCYYNARAEAKKKKEKNYFLILKKKTGPK